MLLVSCCIRIKFTMEFVDFSVNRDDVFNLHKKTQEDLDSDLAILKEWMKKQPHLPMDSLGDDFLEIQLMKNKFSIEKTKSKIEGYCTLKRSIIFKYIPKNELPSLPTEAQCYIPLPRLTDDFHRIVIGKIFNEKEYEHRNDMVNSMILREFLSRFDYNNGEIYIMDFSECSATFLTKFRPNVLYELELLTLKGHSARVSQVHIISKQFSALFALAKPVLPAKLISRTIVHTTTDTVANYVPAECLPKEYGGHLKNLKEIRDDLNAMYQKEHKRLASYLNTVSLEELRIGGPVVYELQGTFRKLNID